MAEKTPSSLKGDDGKETIVLIGVLLVLILIVGGALFFIITQKGGAVQPPPSNQTVTPPPKTNLTNVTEPCEDQCLFERAIRDKNVSGCPPIASETLEQSCYTQLSNVSLEACKAVSDSATKGSCLTAFAIAEDNISICEFLVESKGGCRLAVDPCISSEDKMLCSALLKNDPGRCGTDSQCLLNYSLTKKNASSCGLIQNAVMSKACTAAILDTDKCSELTAGPLRDYCYELFAIYSDDYPTCTQTTPNSIYALDCYSIFAARMGNYTVCDSDGFDLNNRWLCYTNYSLLSGDLAGCENIHKLATTNRFRCSFEYAKKFGNPAACQAIDELGSRSTCYQGTIIYSNANLDWHFCKDITNFNWMNKCYTESAKLYSNISLCDSISESFARDSCRDSFSANETIN